MHYKTPQTGRKFGQPPMTFSLTSSVLLLVKITHPLTTSSPECFPTKTIRAFLASSNRDTYRNMMAFQNLTAVTNTVILCDVTPSCSVDWYRRFERRYFLHLQGERIEIKVFMITYLQYGHSTCPPKRSYLHNKLHGVIFRNTTIFAVTVFISIRYTGVTSLIIFGRGSKNRP
jgi:hypothetical protein